MIEASLLILLGFGLLIFGANWLVDGASLLAKKFNISDLAIGLTVVAFGTSAPELVVNIIASLDGYSDIVLGNVIGSNNFNLFLIIGVTGIIMPIFVKTTTAWKEIPISLLAATLLMLMANNLFLSTQGDIDKLDAIILLILFCAFIFYVFTQLKNDNITEDVEQKQKPMWQVIALITIGLACLVFGGRFVVNNSVSIASHLGVNEKIIGLTIVAAGTSLPELVTSVVAALKRNSDIAVGNAIGSNIFNILLIAPVSAFISTIQYNTKFNLDLLVLIGGTLLLLLFMVTGKKKKLDRWEAIILLLIFCVYMAYSIIQEA